MAIVRQADVFNSLQQGQSQPIFPTSENSQVAWDDQDIADAFIEKGKSHGVTISPDTAHELANNVRVKVKKNDVLELNSVINEIMESLFPKNLENAATKAALDIIAVISNRITKFKNVLAQYSGPIEADEEKELRATILNDILIPLQEGISDKAADATRKLMKDLLPLTQNKNELEKDLKNDEKVKALYEDWKTNPKDNKKKKLYKQEAHRRDGVAVRAIELLNQINVIKSKLIILDRASGYIKKDLEVLDQFRGHDGMTRYFERVLEPGIANIKEIILKVRRNIVLPEVDAKTRHEREWIMRHHLTKSYQTGDLGPSMDNITLDDFKQSPVYEELHEKGVSDQVISTSLDQLDSKPMTWRKGQAIYMLMDPPAEKTVTKDIPTMLNEVPGVEGGKREDWSADYTTNQPFNIEKGKFEEQKGKMIKDTRPWGMSKERKVSEAENENAHWSVLFNLTRNQKVDASGKTRAEKYIESLPEEVQANVDAAKDVLTKSHKMNEEGKKRYFDSQDQTVKIAIRAVEKAEEMEEEDHLNDKEIIYAALWNPSTPDWVLMKTATTGYADTIRRIALAILKKKRGWQPVLDASGDLVKDEETNDFIWERTPDFKQVASFDIMTVIGQVAAPQAPMNPSQQQAMGTKNALQQQINSIDTQLQTHQQQSQQLQVQKVNLQKQMDSVKVPASPAQPATTTQPAPGAAPVENTGMPPAQPMAADTISFRKFAEETLFEDVEV